VVSPSIQSIHPSIHPSIHYPVTISPSFLLSFPQLPLFFTLLSGHLIISKANKEVGGRNQLKLHYGNSTTNFLQLL
jgi:hypothetical protein